MMTPRQPFQPISWLDQFVRRFQDRWETSPQYRSLVLGLAGLALVLTLCACTGLLTLEGSNLLESVGLTNSTNNNNSNIDSNTGTNSGQQAQSFPTATFGPFSGQSTPPGASLPNSQTPLPGATATTTVNPNGSPTPGGGGGGGTNTATFQCSGGNSGVTWTFAPCPLVHGQAGTLTITAPKYANAATNIVLSFGNCTAGSNCAVVDSPASGFKLDGSGAESISLSVPADVQVGGPPVSGEIGISGGPTVGINTQGSVT